MLPELVWEEIMLMIGLSSSSLMDLDMEMEYHDQGQDTGKPYKEMGDDNSEKTEEKLGCKVSFR